MNVIVKCCKDLELMVTFPLQSSRLLECMHVAYVYAHVRTYLMFCLQFCSINNGSGMCMPESQLMNIRVISGSILSAAAQRLLQEFGLRFGVVRVHFI